MHRGGGVEDELLAISPPPEFQDIPAPPPVVFRDHLSPGGQSRGIKINKGKGHSCPASPEVWDFASRISFDILNEAMVIATEEVLSTQHGGGGCNSRRTAPLHFDPPFTSDSSDDEVSHPLSTTTSWEYLSKASSWSDLRDIAQSRRRCSPSKKPLLRVRTSPRHHANSHDIKITADNKISSSSTKHSNSRKQHTNHINNPVSFHNEASCTSSTNNDPTNPSNPPPLLMTTSSSFQLEINTSNTNTKSQQHSRQLNCKDGVPYRNNCQRRTPRDRNSLDSSTTLGKMITGNEECCYNLPYQCDIYSFPIDSIAPDEIEANNQRPIAAPRRSRLGNSQLMNANATGNSSSRDDTTRTKNGTLISQEQRRNMSAEEERKLRGQSKSPVLPGPSTLISSRLGESTNKKTPLSAAVSLDTTKLVSQERNCGVDARNRSFNLNNESSGTEDEGGGRKSNTSTTTRRSRSVEMKISDIGTGNFHTDTSRMRILSKENRPAACGDTSTKSEKRTLGHSILNLFKRKPRSTTSKGFNNLSASVASFHHHSSGMESESDHHKESCTPTISRALPPTPTAEPTEAEPTVQISTSFLPSHLELNWPDSDDSDPAPTSPVEVKDFAASIEKVKDCGWYWGPLSSEAAEDLLRGEPDGSFIVRDSSDAHYIFSLTFKLNGLVRHVRIEHDQGNFSFGPLTRFKASTIVDFVEKAVAHSRSGRYLFFLHRRPILGPMRVQLLHPYSRYKHHRSLQHMCRFVILKYVRRDLINTLPLPKPLQDYLNTPHYYFEKHEEKKICSS